MDSEIFCKESNIFYNVLCFLVTENEKLFDRSDSNLYWRTVFHMVAILHHVYASLQGFNMKNAIEFNDIEEVRNLYRFRIAFLTGWNFLFQTIFLCLSLTHDILEWLDKDNNKLGKKIRYWRDVLFNGLVVPTTVFVSAMFWTVYFIDRELVFPKDYDVFVPFWFNHCLHTNILAVIGIETILTARRNPTNLKLELISTTVLTFGYAVLYYGIYFFAGIFLYNVHYIFNWWQHCLFQSMIWISFYIFYSSQFFINRLIHGSEKITQEEQRREPEVGKRGSEFTQQVENEMKLSRSENSRL